MNLNKILNWIMGIILPVSVIYSAFYVPEAIMPWLVAWCWFGLAMYQENEIKKLKSAEK